MKFNIGQVFEGSYPIDVAKWCNDKKNMARILEIESSSDGKRKFQIFSAPPTNLETEKMKKLEEINFKCDLILQQAVSSYPQTEQQTFYKQDYESTDYLKNPETAETPFLSMLSSARGIELAAMVAKVRYKTDTFASLSAYICGQRQAMEDKLGTCTTIEDVQAIDVNYKLNM